jgi:hypothetical protein
MAFMKMLWKTKIADLTANVRVRILSQHQATMSASVTVTIRNHVD